MFLVVCQDTALVYYTNFGMATNQGEGKPEPGKLRLKLKERSTNTYLVFYFLRLELFLYSLKPITIYICACVCVCVCLKDHYFPNIWPVNFILIFAFHLFVTELFPCIPFLLI